jgi:hypothetical protein
MWEVMNGKKIPDGLLARHACDNPCCINPKHIEIGTHKDNTQDMIKRGRNNPRRGDQHHARLRPETMVNGERHGLVKVTEKVVLKIKFRYSRGDISQAKLGKEYGLSHQQVSRIVRGERWAHLA